MMVTVQQEEVNVALMDELMGLLELHRQEVSMYDDIELGVDVERYIALYNAGSFKAFIARNDDGNIVGYVAYIISHNLHYKKYLYAIQDVIYVEQSNRGGRIAIQLLRESEKYLREIGVSVITQHVKVFKDFGKMLEAEGYEWAEKIFMKRLK